MIGYIISNGPFWVTFGCHCFLTSSINIPYILVVDPKTKDTSIPTWEDMPMYGKDTAFFWVTILKRIFMVTLFLTNQTSRMFEQNHKLYPDLFRKDTRERVLSYIIRDASWRRSIFLLLLFLFLFGAATVSPDRTRCTA